MSDAKRESALSRCGSQKQDTIVQPVASRWLVVDPILIFTAIYSAVKYKCSERGINQEPVLSIVCCDYRIGRG